MTQQPRHSNWPSDRLAEARAVIADVAHHSDPLIRLACNVLVQHGETQDERTSTQRLLLVIEARRPSRGDYHWQHEPCWYAVRAKGKGHWAGDRTQTTLWQIANRDQDADTVHGTQKPVECMRRPILNNSSPGQAVYEPFMGSGTTLIAAETTGRVCFGVELNQAYVDVAIERWQSFSGEVAVLVDTGESFAALKATRLAA